MSRENGKDYLHGYPVTFSTAMPASLPRATPLFFGDFKQGYVIGDRGGSGNQVKILDQPKAVEGIFVLLGYRRTDGRVRRSEAVQAVSLAQLTETARIHIPASGDSHTSRLPQPRAYVCGRWLVNGLQRAGSENR